MKRRPAGRAVGCSWLLASAYLLFNLGFCLVDPSEPDRRVAMTGGRRARIPQHAQALLSTECHNSIEGVLPDLLMIVLKALDKRRESGRVTKSPQNSDQPGSSTRSVLTLKGRDEEREGADAELQPRVLVIPTGIVDGIEISPLDLFRRVIHALSG